MPLSAKDDVTTETEVIMGEMAYEPEVQRIIEVENEEHNIMMLGQMVRRVEFDNEFLQSDDNFDRIDYDEFGNRLPDEFDSKVYPNPTLENAQLEIAVAEDGTFVVDLFDLNGRHIQNIHEGELERGTHTYHLPLFNENPGMFLVIIRSKNYSKSIKLSKL